MCNFTEKVTDAILNEQFEDLYDPNFQPVFGKFPPTSTLRERFRPGSGGDREFRLWKHRAAQRYIYWIRESSVPMEDRIFITDNFFRCIDEKPPVETLKRRKPERKPRKSKKLAS